MLFLSIIAEFKKDNKLNQIHGCLFKISILP